MKKIKISIVLVNDPHHDDHPNDDSEYDMPLDIRLRKYHHHRVPRPTSPNGWSGTGYVVATAAHGGHGRPRTPYAILPHSFEHSFDWCTHFNSLAQDALLLWCVFRMPCTQLMEVGYATAPRAGGIQDIVRTCQELVGDGQPLPRNIKAAQQEMHTYRLRVSTSFPDDSIGDGLSALHVVDQGWLGSGDAPINDEPLSALLWQNIEQKLGCSRYELVDTRQRVRIDAYDTQEVRM